MSAYGKKLESEVRGFENIGNNDVGGYKILLMYWNFITLFTIHTYLYL